MSDIIKPTVGRKVWFMPGNETQFTDAMGCPVKPKIISGQPMDATIVYVWGDRMVNLLVVDHIGNPFSLTSVTLVQESDAYIPANRHCVWMPYQKGQARKEASIVSGSPIAATQADLDRAVTSMTVAKGFSLDDDAPLVGGVCDMSAGCEACQ